MANLTKKVNLAKMEDLVTICRGLANFLVGWQKESGDFAVVLPWFGKFSSWMAKGEWRF